MELRQYLKMTQQLVMTPQLQQAIKLLQLSRMELTDTINQELMENPVLEAGEVEAMEPAEVQKGLDEGQVKLEAQEKKEEVQAVDEAAGEMDWERFVEDYNQYSYSPGAGGVRYSDDDMPTLEQTLTRHENLTEHLEWQVGLTPLTDAEEAVALEIVGNISDTGYLNGEMLPIIAEDHGMPLDEVEAVLEVIQTFDPVGVAARDLKECLLIQARHDFPRDRLLQALIARHLGHLENRKIGPILKDLDIDKKDLAGLVELLSTLEPRPGRGFGEVAAQYITPDVYVHKVGGEYVVTLNEDGMPKLKISNFYENRIKARKATGDEKAFIQDKFKSAVWLIRSIHQRQNTIRRVTESIVRFQREFLDKGVAYLRPLILREVADDIGMHESTISRVTTNKYVHTPRGIFELKYFFNSRITTTTGRDVASEAVKQRIKKLVSTEDPEHPLSDQKICDILAEEGTTIARRTVAKYREMLHILSSSKRKKLF